MEHPSRSSSWRSFALLLLACLALLLDSARAAKAARRGSARAAVQQQQLIRQEKGYDILVRRRDAQRTSDAEGGAGAGSSNVEEGLELPSFDGDVGAIFELAMAKALKQELLLPSDYPSIVPIRWTPAPSPPVFDEAGGVRSDRPSLVPSLAPSGVGSGFAGAGASDRPSLVPSDVPSITPSEAPTSSDGGLAGRSDYPSLVPAGWPTTPTPVLSVPSGVPSDAPSTAPTTTQDADTDFRPLGTPAPTATAHPTMVELLNPHSCADDEGADPAQSATFLMTLRFVYTLETTPSAPVNTVVGEAEEALQEAMGPEVLSCLNQDSKVKTDAAIVALDSLPRDFAVADQTCDPHLDSDNTCSVVQGAMRFFLSKSGAAQAATDLVNVQLADILNSVKFSRDVGTGLLRSQLLSVEQDAPTVTEVGERDPARESDASVSGQQSVTPTVLMAVAGTALVVFVASVYYWRRSYNRNIPSAATQMAGSSFNDNGDMSTRAPSSNSPFSEMLPDAYRFNGNMSIMSGQGTGMSAIIEDEEGTLHSHTSSNIFMSETGFSEQAAETDTSLMSFDIPKSLYTRVPESPNLLGARKRNLDQVVVTDSGDDTSLSDVESSSVLDDTATPDSPVARHGALPNNAVGAGSRITSLLDDPELAPPRPSARPQRLDTSADDSMHADELLLFC